MCLQEVGTNEKNLRLEKNIEKKHFRFRKKKFGTGKSLSETLIFASTNPQYDDRLFIEL